MVVSLPKKIKNEHGIDTDDWDIDTLVPLIDGGTEGWMGQSRVIYPYFTPCFECLLHLFPSDPLNFQVSEPGYFCRDISRNVLLL